MEKTKTSDKIEAKKCSYCPRMIIRADEIDGVYFLHQGKRMCMVCRATKLSKFKKQIKSTRAAMRKDIVELNEAHDLEENQRVMEMAADSMEKMPEDLRVKPKERIISN